MVETAMLVVAGFLAACLLALVLAPLQWRRAVRLTEQRVRALIPLSIAEIEADKDRLRAEFALKRRRLENALEKIKEDNAVRRVEIARVVELAKLRGTEAQTSARTVSELERELEELRQKLIHAESETKAHLNALKKAQSQITMPSRELEIARREAREAKLLADEQKVKIAALETHLASDEEQIRGISASTDLPREDPQQVFADISMKLRQATLRDGELARMKTEFDRVKGELSLARAELSAQLLEIEALRQEKAARDRAAEKARLRGDADKPAADEGEAADAAGKTEDETMDAGQAEMTEEKKRLVAEVEALRRELASSRERDRVENEALRERLADIAAKVAHMSAALEGGDPVIEEILRKSAPARKPRSAKAATKSSAAKSGNAKTKTGKAGAGKEADEKQAAGDKTEAETPPEPTTLADRIRALQQHISSQI
jgi:hypothetical protein